MYLAGPKQQLVGHSSHNWQRTGGQETISSPGQMGQRCGVHVVLHSLLGWVRQCVEISLHCSQKRRRSLPDTVLGGAVSRGTTHLLSGDGDGTVFKPGSCQNLRSQSSHARYWSGSIHCHVHRHDVLHADTGDHVPLLGGLVQCRTALGQV